MRLLIPLITALVFISCNNNGKKGPTSSTHNSTTADQPPVPQKLEPVKGTPADIPASLAVNGNVQEVWKWTDRSGENMLVLSVVPPYDDAEKNEYGEEGQSAELHAALYVKKEGAYSPVWSWSDREKSCPFDITCEFIRDGATVTDLDADGIAETCLQYKRACRSDVSPALMRIVLQEGSSKYVLKGLMWLKASPEDLFTVTEKDANLETLPGYKGTEDEFMKTFGRYESEQSFAGAPPEFLTHARRQWMRFVIETTE